MSTLTTQHFAVNRGTLILKHPGAVLVLFCSKEDSNSKVYFPVFKQLTNSYKGIQYGLLDVRDNSEVIQRSRESSTPITAVPSLLLYINGIPRAKIPPKKDVGGTIKLIEQSLATISAKREPQRQPQHSSWMPDMSQQPRYQPEQPPARFEDPEESLLTPDSITPYNTPWNVGRE